MTKPLAIILDRLARALDARGVTLPRHQLHGIASEAFGHVSPNETSRLSSEGKLTPPTAELIETVSRPEGRIAILKSPEGLWGVEAQHLSREQSQRADRFMPTPYGGLAAVDTFDIKADHEHPDEWTVDKESAGALAQIRDLEEDLKAGHTHRTAVRAIALARELDQRVSNLTVLGPDWFSWDRDLKKAATRGAEPISDADLDIVRQAVADNHCKSSAGERAEAEYRVQRFMTRHARGILLRLDMAEAATGSGGVQDAVHDVRDGLPCWHLVSARDGDVVDIHFRARNREAAEARASAHIAQAFGIEDVGYDDIGAECDGTTLESASEVDAQIDLIDASRAVLAMVGADARRRNPLLRRIAATESALPRIYEAGDAVN